LGWLVTKWNRLGLRMRMWGGEGRCARGAKVSGVRVETVRLQQ
jgi:hypothetical protein